MDSYEYTPLIFACLIEWNPGIELLLKYGANIEKRTNVSLRDHNSTLMIVLCHCNAIGWTYSFSILLQRRESKSM